MFLIGSRSREILFLFSFFFDGARFLLSPGTRAGHCTRSRVLRDIFGVIINLNYVKISLFLSLSLTRVRECSLLSAIQRIIIILGIIITFCYYKFIRLRKNSKSRDVSLCSNNRP